MTTHTYTIYDGHPAVSGSCSWPHAECIEIEADDDGDAIAAVRDVLEAEATGLSAADGYEEAAQIWANVWDSDGILIATISQALVGDDTVTVETMPDCHRGSHRAAGNWGAYPFNGAEREQMSREEAEQIVAYDPDGYAHIVE